MNNATTRAILLKCMSAWTRFRLYVMPFFPSESILCDFIIVFSLFKNSDFADRAILAFDLEFVFLIFSLFERVVQLIIVVWPCVIAVFLSNIQARLSRCSLSLSLSLSWLKAKLNYKSTSEILCSVWQACMSSNRF